MASPLSPTKSTMLNLSTPPTSRRTDKVEVQTYASPVPSNDGAAAAAEIEDGDSSPFLTNVRDAEQDIISPAKARHSRIMSGNELSPLKILQASTSSSRPAPATIAEAAPLPNRQSMQMPPPRSPRKISPLEKRFPIKVSTPLQTSFQPPAQTPAQTPAETPRARPTHERQMSLEDAISENAGLKHAIEIFEDEESVLETGAGGDVENTATITVPMVESEEHVDDEMASADDTMVSTFSTFSAVPSMTTFARLGQTPVRGGPTGMNSTTPMATPRAGPLPNRGPPRDTGNTTNLLDFTEQLRFPQGRSDSPSKNGAPTPAVAAAARTPQRQSLANLLDFDIPPLPTPRSIPTVTPRELESLKSNFLSEISSLKATLSGKEAEVTSLKAALGDAEKRAGESTEQLREERTLREQLAVDKDTWEKRGREMENILRKVKEEIVLSQREREDLEYKLDEAEKRREAAEMMAQDAESKMAGMRAGKLTAEGERVESPSGVRSPPSKTQKEVEIAVERVARELHALYKGKHETKVAALKESYKGRWEKKVRELEERLEDLAKENEDLRIGRDATMTKVDPNAAAADEERREQAAKDSAQIKELGAEVQKLEATVKSVQNDNSELRRLLELERVEKGELVILAEEMMSMQQSFVAGAEDKKRPASAGPPPKAQQSASSSENFRASGPRTSMLKTPGSIPRPGESRIGRVQQHHERKQSIGTSGIGRPGSGQAVRSGIMSSIEKMGNYRGRGD